MTRSLQKTSNAGGQRSAAAGQDSMLDQPISRAALVGLGAAAAAVALPLAGCAGAGSDGQDFASFLDALGDSSGAGSPTRSRAADSSGSAGAGADSPGLAASASRDGMVQGSAIGAGGSSQDADQKSAGISRDALTGLMDFSLDMAREAAEHEGGGSGLGTVVVSPLSVAYALAMLANGAGGSSLSQIEDALGSKLDALNVALRSFSSLLSSSDSDSVSLAHSVWANKDTGFELDSSYQRLLKRWYSAQLSSLPFDSAAAEAINSWVSEKTRGMIGQIIDSMPASAVLYLVSAIAFEALWAEQYKASDVYEGMFTGADGSQQSAHFMHSAESILLSDSHAQGIVKPYRSGRYAFAALVPDEDTTLQSYLSGLTGERLRSILADADTGAWVAAELPRFEASFQLELNAILASLGIKDVFDAGAADLSGLGTAGTGDGLVVSDVLHATYIQVNETGTKAAAVTSIELRATAAPLSETISFNRPFVFALVECKTLVPLFVGVITQLPQESDS